jgi:glyoxylase-like metal-dependent hydrolase (beta-lactamase superfamily II)
VAQSAGSDANKANPNKLIHEILPVGLLECNCHIVADPITHDAIVIDPGDDVARILEILSRHKLTVRAILNTHAHIDHVGGLKKLREVTGAPVLMHESDLRLYHMLDEQANFIQLPMPPISEVDDFLREGGSVKWGNYELRVIHTPGHSEGSVCLYLPHGATQTGGQFAIAAPKMNSPGRVEGAGWLFAGDTLFSGSIGRTDLWGGSTRDILRSLRSKLLVLPDATIVFPGHGPITTIGEERESNPFLRNL